MGTDLVPIKAFDKPKVSCVFSWDGIIKGGQKLPNSIKYFQQNKRRQLNGPIWLLVFTLSPMICSTAAVGVTCRLSGELTVKQLINKTKQDKRNQKKNHRPLWSS